jgi:hypothetical protein
MPLSDPSVLMTRACGDWRAQALTQSTAPRDARSAEFGVSRTAGGQAWSMPTRSGQSGGRHGHFSLWHEASVPPPFNHVRPLRQSGLANAHAMRRCWTQITPARGRNDVALVTFVYQRGRTILLGREGADKSGRDGMRSLL